MTSVQFSLSPQLLLEYGYTVPQDPATTFDTSFVRHSLVRNGYTGDQTLFQTALQGPVRTNNPSDWTVVELPASAGRIGEQFVLLDQDGAYFYPNLDPTISIQTVNPAPPLDVQFDRVRVQVLSGYHFEDCAGFVLSFYLRTATDEVLRLCHTAYLRQGDRQRLRLNPRPLQLADRVYDKYLELLVPSLSSLLDAQNQGQDGPGSVIYRLTNGRGLAPNSSIYCEFQVLSQTESRDGLLYLTPRERVRFSLPAQDQYSGLVAKIQEAKDGDYFQYAPEFSDGSIEDYLYRLNAVPGQDFFLIHDLILLEQIGQEFRETDSFSQVQTRDFSDLGRYRPILRYGDQATTFSIQYTARLVNRVDGRSIFKSATISSFDVAKYGRYGARLDVLGLEAPQKVYNQIQGTSPLQIRETLLTLTRTKTLTVYTDANRIRVRSTTDLQSGLGDVPVLLTLHPFDNVYRFELLQTTPGNAEGESPLPLDPYSTYFLVFPFGPPQATGNKAYLPAILQDPSEDLQEGELLFQLPVAEATRLASGSYRKWYLIGRTSAGLETVLISGDWEAAI